MTTEALQAKLQALRERWKREPENRKVIEMQAKVIKMALELSDDSYAREVLVSLG